MTKDECYELGYITKVHALKGEVVVFLDTDEPEGYAEMESVFLEIAGNLVPFFIEQINVQGNRAIVKFEEIDTIEKASELVNAKLWLPLNLLSELEEGQFYYHQVIGYQVVDKEKGKLGKVSTIYANNMQDLLAMQYKGREVLIPLVSAIVQEANHEKQEIYVTLPEGLLEIYLEG
ncbi:MAG: ribosome maturation factor RimM [Microscillaceae bacterium]|nr:ribosome maturation factor RimM [Microscillaceae bacterium]MDW8460055.1 ribosome maturation factor RimM [Cytophagales bacterium]